MSPRGSLKHVLDLFDSGRFAQTMSDMLGKHGVQIGEDDAWRPLGYNDQKEWTLEKFCGEHCRDWFDYSRFKGWWNISNGNPPQWDILSICTIDGSPGLLLVEAKANDRELIKDGKRLEKNVSPDTLKNHDIIGRCIDEACKGLNTGHKKQCFGISRDSHYQLSNRIASAWKLAECGLPVALLYLGFTGDEGIRSAGEPIKDRDHWQRLMGAYMHGIAPQHFPGTVLSVSDKGHMRMLIESLPVINISPSPEA